MRIKIFGLFGLLALGAVAAGLAAAAPASAQGYGYGLPVAVPIEAAAAPVSLPLNFEPVGAIAVAGAGVNEAPAPANVPAGCSLYDSWCAYCGNHPGVDLCLQTPPQPAGTGISMPGQDTQPDSGTTLLAPAGGVFVSVSAAAQ